MDPSEVRIFLRPIGSPLTIGMSGLAIASLVLSGLELGWIAKSESHQVAIILIAVPFVMQTLASVYSYLARDGATGAALGTLGSAWLGLGLVLLSSRPGTTSGAVGLLLLAAAGALGLSALAVSLAKPLIGATFLIAALRFAVGGIYQLSRVSAWQHAGGIAGLVMTGLALYAVIAFELEGELHRTILPTFRIGPGKATPAARGEAETLAAEPGVRPIS